MLIVENPEVAAAIAAVLLISGITLVVFIAKRIRRGWRAGRSVAEAVGWSLSALTL